MREYMYRRVIGRTSLGSALKRKVVLAALVGSFALARDVLHRID
jgi:hypothetical protein